MDKGELTQLMQKRSDLTSLSIILLHVAFVITPIFIASLTPIGWHYLLLWFWFGVAANGLTLLLHECAHYLPFKKKKRTRFFACWFLGPLLLTDFDVYRQRHWIHHKDVGKHTDTKKTYLVRIDGINALFLVIKIIFMYEALQAVLRQFSQLSKHASDSNRQNKSASFAFLPFFVFQGCFILLIGACTASVDSSSLYEVFLHFFVVYGFVYCYGLGSLTVLLAHVRSVAEHSAVVADDGKVEGVATLRTMKANWLMRLIFGTYGFADHAAHHLFPGVPYYNLPKVSKQLSSENIEFRPTYGYLQLMWLGFRSKV